MLDTFKQLYVAIYELSTWLNISIYGPHLCRPTSYYRMYIHVHVNVHSILSVLTYKCIYIYIYINCIVCSGSDRGSDRHQEQLDYRDNAGYRYVAI